ncbi:MAG: LPXTG cell wall anchor domain-containing protein [Methanotrichaceae archaeon]
MSRIFLISAMLLLILLIGSSQAYEYHMPVNIQTTMTPSVLMPGDEAIVAIDLQNGAAAYGAGRDAGAGSAAAGTVLSTPINQTTLLGTKEIQVISSDYKDLGMIGPNDKITLYYKIKADENTPSGTYFLDFSVQGGYDMIQINREIPVKVDSAAVNIARADVPTKPSIDLNIANPRENTLNAVTIIPTAPGVRFSPDQYYIGTMDPDEVFTISFGVDSAGPARQQMHGLTNISFVSKFKNGDNWHQSGAYTTTYSPPVDGSRQNNYLMPAAGAAILIIAGAGIFLYRRRKNSKTQKQR